MLYTNLSELYIFNAEHSLSKKSPKQTMKTEKTRYITSILFLWFWLNNLKYRSSGQRCGILGKNLSVRAHPHVPDNLWIIIIRLIEIIQCILYIPKTNFHCISTTFKVSFLYLAADLPHSLPPYKVFTPSQWLFICRLWTEPNVLYIWISVISSSMFLLRSHIHPYIPVTIFILFIYITSQHLIHK